MGSWILAVIASVVAAELYLWCPFFARKIIKWNSNLIEDANEKARLQEEWLANVELIPGNLSKLLFAISLLRGSIAIRHSESIVEAEETDDSPQTNHRSSILLTTMQLVFFDDTIGLIRFIVVVGISILLSIIFLLDPSLLSDVWESIRSGFE